MRRVNRALALALLAGIATAAAPWLDASTSPGAASAACLFDCAVVESCANDAGCLGPCRCDEGECVPD